MESHPFWKKWFKCGVFHLRDYAFRKLLLLLFPRKEYNLLMKFEITEVFLSSSWMERRTRKLLYLSLGKFCNLLGEKICIACKQINGVNPAAASLADGREVCRCSPALRCWTHFLCLKNRAKSHIRWWVPILSILIKNPNSFFSSCPSNWSDENFSKG